MPELEECVNVYAAATRLSIIFTFGTYKFYLILEGRFFNANVSVYVLILSLFDI